MNIPDKAKFFADQLINAGRYSGYELCFACAVRFVMAGGNVTMEMSYEEGGTMCHNETCETGGIPKALKVNDL